MRQLEVYMNNHRAGLLTENRPGKGYSFCYYPEYLATSMPPISVTLPKRVEAYKSEHLFPLFSNMLPEGANRKIICRSSRIDEKDFFGMLMAMAGRDFIGAVNVKTVEK